MLQLLLTLTLVFSVGASVYAAPPAKKPTAMERLEQLETRRNNEEMRLQMGLGLTRELQQAYEQLAKDFPKDAELNNWIQYRLAEVEYSRDQFDQADQRLQNLEQKSLHEAVGVQAGVFRSDIKKSKYNSKANEKEADQILEKVERKYSNNDYVKVSRTSRDAQLHREKGAYQKARSEVNNRLSGNSFKKRRGTNQEPTPWEREAENKYNEELAKAKRGAAFDLAAQGSYLSAYQELSRLIQDYNGPNPYDYFTMNTTTEDLAYQKALALAAAGSKEQAIKELREFIVQFPNSYLAIRAQEKLDELSPPSPPILPSEVKVKAQSAAGGAKIDCVCGPAALQTVLAAKGIQASLEQLVLDAGTTEKGTTMTGLIEAAKLAGVSAFGVRVSTTAMTDLQLPAIVLLQDHYVTVSSIEGSSVTLYDPMIGWATRSRSEIDPLWSGYAIVFANTEVEALSGLAGAAVLTREQTDRLVGKYTCSNAGGFGGVPGGPDCNQPCGNFQVSEPYADGYLDGMQTSINRIYGNLAVQTPQLVFRGSEGVNSDVRMYFNSTSSDNRPSPVGAKWSLTYTDRLVASNLNPNNLDLETSDGSRLTYTRNIDGTYTSPPNNFDKLIKNADNSHTILKKNNDRMEFNAAGQLIKQVDRLEQGVDLIYDNQNRLIRITDTSGVETSFVYGANGEIAKIDAAGEYQIDLLYDSNNRLTQIVYPDNESYRFSYTSGFAITDRQGQTTKFEYFDAGGQITARINPDGSRMNINAANASGGSITNYAGKATSFSWDNRRILTAQTDPLGNRTTYSYTPDHKIETVTDPLGNKTKFYYDSRGNRTTVEDALGNKTHYVYNKKNELTAVVDALGRRTWYAYDESGNLTTVTNASGRVMTYSYDASGELTGTIDYAGAATSYDYDDNGRLVSATNALNHTVAYEYDNLGRRIAETNASGYRTQYEYDLHGHIVKVIHPNGSVETMEYTGELLMSRTDALGRTVSYEYDNLGRLKKVTDPLGGSTQYTYDAMGNQTSITDATGKSTRKTYDAKNRLTGVTFPGNQKESYAYDANDRLTVKTEVSGAITTYTYDALGRVIKTERK